jgi:hypothetical protein
VSVEQLIAELNSDLQAEGGGSGRRPALVGAGASESGTTASRRSWRRALGATDPVLIVHTGVLVAAADRNDGFTRHARGSSKRTVALGDDRHGVAEVAYLMSRELGRHAEASLYAAVIDGDLAVEAINSDEGGPVSARSLRAMPSFPSVGLTRGSSPSANASTFGESPRSTTTSGLSDRSTAMPSSCFRRVDK